MNLEVTAGAAFAAGLLSFVSPCVLPLVPPYLAFIGGVSIGQLTQTDNPALRWRVMAAALAFIAGFAAVFVILGATASWIGRAVTAHLQFFGYLAGAMIFLLGLHFLGIIRIALLDRTASVGVTTKPAGLFGAFVVGLAFAFGWSPCVGPVLAAILLVAGAKESVGEGAWLLLVYALGIGIPFLIAAAFAGPFMRWAARWRGYLGTVEKVIGVLLLVTGVAIFTGQMPLVANWLVDTFPFLGRIG